VATIWALSWVTWSISCTAWLICASPSPGGRRLR
jgi:hypothetical protein